MAGRQRDDVIRPGEEEWTGGDEERTGPPLDERRERGVYVALGAISQGAQLPADQVFRERRQAVELTAAPAVFDRHVPAFDEACFIQAAAERGQQGDVGLGRSRAEIADGRHRRLLRACSERPRRGAAYERDE